MRPWWANIQHIIKRILENEKEMGTYFTTKSMRNKNLGDKRLGLIWTTYHHTNFNFFNRLETKFLRNWKNIQLNFFLSNFWITFNIFYCKAKRCIKLCIFLHMHNRLLFITFYISLTSLYILRGYYNKIWSIWSGLMLLSLDNEICIGVFCCLNTWEKITHCLISSGTLLSFLHIPDNTSVKINNIKITIYNYARLYIGSK